MAGLSVQSLPRTEVIKVELLNETVSDRSPLWIVHIDVAIDFLKQRKRFPLVLEELTDSPYRCAVCERFTHRQNTLHIAIEELVTVAESGRCGGCSMIYHALHAEVFQQQAEEFSHLLLSKSWGNYPGGFCLADSDGELISPWYELFVPQGREVPFFIFLWYFRSDISRMDPLAFKIGEKLTPFLGAASPWEVILIRPTKSGNTSSQQALSWARDKIHHCQTQHKSCGAGFASQLPARVLDVRNIKLGEAQQDGCIRLYSPEKEVAPYVCLSHCWGTNQPLRTIRDNVDEFHHSISWMTLPKTFRDAVLVTVELGIHYLWIDSLCIVQDDENDWRVESAKMASIYQGSVVTLAASASVDSAGGLFYNCSSQFVDKLIQIGETGKSIFGIRRPVNHRESLGDDKVDESSTLLTRAWVFQERLLAPDFSTLGLRSLFWSVQKKLLANAVTQTSRHWPQNQSLSTPKQ